MKSPTSLPYFEGDYWLNTIEDSIREINQEEEERRKEEWNRKHYEGLQQQQRDRDHAAHKHQEELRLKNEDKLTFFNLQKYMKIHYPSTKANA